MENSTSKSKHDPKAKKKPPLEEDKPVIASAQVGSTQIKIVKDSSFHIKEIENILKGSVVENITGDVLENITFWLTMANKNKAMVILTLKKGWIDVKVSFAEGVNQTIKFDDQIQETV